MSESAGFLLAAAALLAATLAILLRPLLRRDAAPKGDPREATLEILREALRELERRRDGGTLDEAGFAQARDELQRRLLEEIGPEPPAVRVPDAPAADAGKRTAIALLLALPLAAAAGYALLGTPRALDPAARTHAPAQTEEMDALLQGLSARLAANPDDPPGWILLARAYRALGRFAESAGAFARAEASLDRDPALLADYAEVLALADGGRFAGKPDALIARALEQAPDDPRVLFIAGASANARRDLAAVIGTWGRLLPRLDPDSDEARALGMIVEQARRQVGDVPGNPR